MALYVIFNDLNQSKIDSIANCSLWEFSAFKVSASLCGEYLICRLVEFRFQCPVFCAMNYSKQMFQALNQAICIHAILLTTARRGNSATQILFFLFFASQTCSAKRLQKFSGVSRWRQPSDSYCCSNAAISKHE